MRKAILIVASALFAMTAVADEVTPTYTEWQDQEVNEVNRFPVHATFFAYETKSKALQGEMERSAFKEISNIVTGSYLNALSTMTNMCIYPSIPDLAIDMAGAILSVPAIEFGIMGDKILLIQSQFYDDVEIDGYFILLPDLDSYSKILTSLGIPVD